MYLVENQFINIRCKQCNEYFKKMNVSLPSVLVINREVCDASFENIKNILLGIEPMTISTIPSVILKPKGIFESFHDALYYLISAIGVKST